MEIKLLKEVIECLSDERRLIHYYPEKYAVFLLKSYLQQRPSTTISHIKSSVYAKLLNKPAVKSILSNCGNGAISSEKMDNYFPQNYESYVVTLSHWDGNMKYQHAQVSRPGANLVLQLNFTGEHDSLLSQKGIDSESFKYYGHPVHRRRNSVAWARIDFDFESGEALIEELQTDWLRKAKKHLQRAKQASRLERKCYWFDGARHQTECMLKYVEQQVKAMDKNWSEIMLYVAVQFIKEELGIGHIYYHTFETGCVIKNIRNVRPPKSLYTLLPKRFCFDSRAKGPSFIMQDKKSKRRLKTTKDPSWYYLEI